MKTIVVDDEHYGLERFKIECEGIKDIELVDMFRKPKDALALAQQEKIELAFLDIEMPEMNGLELSDRLREIIPDIIIIFLSAHAEYMQDAFTKRGADYYLVKPYTKHEIISVIERAKLLSKRFAKRIYIETFGRFGVYLDQKPVCFTSENAKELLAMMVDKRGTLLSNQSAFNYIWPNRIYNNESSVLLFKVQRRLKDTLAKYGIEELVIQASPSEYKVDVELFDCDYYQFLNNDYFAIKKYNGEYMDNWDWGETTAAYLQKLKLRYDKTFLAAPDNSAKNTGL